MSGEIKVETTLEKILRFTKGVLVIIVIPLIWWMWNSDKHHAALKEQVAGIDRRIDDLTSPDSMNSRVRYIEDALYEIILAYRLDVELRKRGLAATNVGPSSVVGSLADDSDGIVSFVEDEPVLPIPSPEEAELEEVRQAAQEWAYDKLPQKRAQPNSDDE